MDRYLIWLGEEDWELEYQKYPGLLLVGGFTYYEESLSSLHHCEGGEVLLAVL